MKKNRANAAQRVAAGIAAAIVAGATLAGCGSQGGDDAAPVNPGPPPSTDYFGYQVASRLVTTNAGSAFGTASNAQVLSSRLYPGAFVTGPDGQLIPNTDLVTAQEIEQSPLGERQVRYRIADKARYSDNVPVACEDFLLSYTAGSMPSTFGSHLPLMNEIQDLQCAPGAKEFVVVLKAGQGDRWRHMFGPGTVLPSHAIAKKAGMSVEDMVTALRSWDPAQVEKIADLWRFGFMLADFDPAMQVSYGPFVIEKVGADGEVILVRNAAYYGDEAAMDKIVVWPRSADSAHLVDTGALRLADFTEGTPDWAKDPARGGLYTSESFVGDLTDSLLLAEDGLFADPGARQAFAACVDQEALAKVSSAESGQDVPPVYVHGLRHNDPLGKQLTAIMEPHRGIDIQRASALWGTTIKVGYLGPDKRYAAMVQALKKSCEPAGITIEDASTDFMSATYMEISEKTGMPTIDAFLGAVDPLTEYATVATTLNNIDKVKDAEAKLWEDVPTVPIAAQPRTFFVDPGVENVVPFTGLSGLSWNMDRWYAAGPLGPAPSDAASASAEPTEPTEPNEPTGSTGATPTTETKSGEPAEKKS